jgi:hypothetical protein
MGREVVDIPGYGEVKAVVTTGRERDLPSPQPGLLAVHRVLGDGKGYSVTHVPTGKHVAWSKTETAAKGLQRRLEQLDWEKDLDEVRRQVEEFQAENLP